MSICIVDTSVFCNVLAVPGRCQDREQATEELREYILADTSLLLPMATVYETGNHIAQVDDGRLRRQAAQRFAGQVKQALTGASPFSPTVIHEAEDVAAWLDEFPEHAAAGIGLGDLSIIKVFEHQCRLHRARRVFIWSYDGDLDGYDRPPML